MLTDRIEMEEGGLGGRQSSSYKTISEGLEEPIHLQLSQTETLLLVSTLL